MIVKFDFGFLVFLIWYYMYYKVSLTFVFL